jgi:SdrD B-like domain
LNGSIGDIHLSVQGEWGHDLGASNVFALNRNQNITASLSVPLVAAVELRVEGYWNQISAVVNPESIFVSQATQEQLYSINRRSLLVRFVRAFQWGKQPPTGHGLPGGDRIPYGLVEGFVFQDVNGNGLPDPGEPPAPGIFIRLDDGQTARSDANGRFAFSNVIEGSHNVGLDLEVLPASYNSPAATAASVRVQRLAPGRHDFGLIPTGSLSGTVEQALSSGERVGFARAVVTLLPNDFSVYTDTDGRYHFSNLPPGRYWVRLEEASLPEGAVVEAGHSEEQDLRAGEEGSVAPLDFSLRIEEKPVQKIFEHEQTVPHEPSTPKRTKGYRQNRSR